MRTHMSRIAFLGLGSMGSRMAANLLAAGYDVRVWNRTLAAAKRLAEARATGAAADNVTAVAKLYD
jgi:3-hydroxyisobutyrate dehydrogenase-like beta-hydroxyacid dehydrogenase